MKSNRSRLKREKDAKQERRRDHVVAGAPVTPPEESSGQDTRYETKKSPQAETRSNLYRARKAGKKSNRYKEECDQNSSGDESSEFKEESVPGAYSIASTHTENHRIEEPQTTIDGSRVNALFAEDTNDRAMVVEANLVPELTSADEVNIQEEEAVIAMKIQYKRALWYAMAFYGLAIVGNIIGFLFLFLNPPQAYGQFYDPIWFGLLESACVFFVATLIMLLATTSCCASSLTLEQYAPDDKELLQETYRASVVTICVFIVPIIVKFPELQWLGYTIMTWYFAGTVFTFSRVQLLRHSTEARQKKPKCIWIIFWGMFLGLSGATIWSCLKPLYPDCNVPRASWIGDGVCDGQPYASEVCGYDGGDCVQLKDYPNCTVDSPHQLGNGGQWGAAFMVATA